MDKKLEIKLRDLLTNHRDEWVIDYHTIRHIPTGIEIWTSNAPYADLSVYRPIKSDRVQGFFNRRSFRKLTDSFFIEEENQENLKQNNLITILKNYKPIKTK